MNLNVFKVRNMKSWRVGVIEAIEHPVYCLCERSKTKKELQAAFGFHCHDNGTQTSISINSTQMP